MAASISTRCRLPHPESEHSFMMTQHHMHPGPPTQPMVTTWARHSITTDASYSTSQPRFCFSDTWHLYPAHRKIPVTSQHDLSILMAAELIKALSAVVPTTTTEKIKHIKAIQDLTASLARRQTPEGPTVHPGTPAPRVAAPIPRVANAPPPRVATTSNNITAPNVIRNMPLVHERHTCHYNPFNILTDDGDDDDTVVASNCSPHNPPPSLPTSALPVRQPANRPTHQLAIQLACLPSPCQPSNPPTSPPPMVNK